VRNGRRRVTDMESLGAILGDAIADSHALMLT
jgi:hypothetical protein